jgi:uncharacterized damage-inducible protein DinB
MTLKDFFLAQLEREVTLTRKTVQRVPEGQNGFKPHERSMELGYLAALVAGMPGWVAFMIDRDELDLSDPSSQAFRPKVVDKAEDLVACTDRAAAEARRALQATTDDHLLTPWAFKMNGQVVQEQPRYLMIADAVFGHLAHHRGQLTVYLRLASSTVPALYGPSADEHF